MSALNNLWNVANLPYGRSSGEVVVELNRRSQPPPPPYELLGAVSDTVWAERMKVLMNHLNVYSWSVMEKVYVGIAFIISIVVPWPIMFLLNRAFAGSVESRHSPDDGRITPLTQSDVQDLTQARYASLGVLIGIYVLLWAPYGLFKSFGSRRRGRILNEWTAQDASPARGPDGRLVWGIRGTSLFHGRSHLVVKLPAGLKNGGIPNASVFAPGAHLPVYVAYPGQWENVSLDEKAGLHAPPPGQPPMPISVQAPPPPRNGGGGYAPPNGPPPSRGFASLNRTPSQRSQQQQTQYAPPSMPPPV